MVVRKVASGRNVVRDVAPERLRNLDDADLRSAISRGEIFVFRNALREANCLQQMAEASLEGVAVALDAGDAAKVAALGFERIHEIVDSERIVDVMEAARLAQLRISRQTAKQLCRHLFGNRRFYMEESPNVRFHLPFDRAPKAKGQGGFRLSGKIIPHGPHHDSWYYCPVNGVNIWIALGKVVKGNGLSIFPDAFGLRLPCDRRGFVKRDQAFGKPTNFEMEAGDILVFSGEHLHSSEINSTQITRHVVSFRVTFDRPVFLGNSPYKYNYQLVLPWSGRTARMIEGAYALYRRGMRRMGKLLRPMNHDRWIASEAELGSFDDMSAGQPMPEWAGAKTMDEQDASAASVANHLGLRRGQVKALSKVHCAALSSDGDLYFFHRFCPHQKADLAAGYVVGSTLYCPWHNLPIDLATGRSPCRSLERLDILEQWSRDGFPAGSRSRVRRAAIGPGAVLAEMAEQSPVERRAAVVNERLARSPDPKEMGKRVRRWPHWGSRKSQVPPPETPSPDA